MLSLIIVYPRSILGVLENLGRKLDRPTVKKIDDEVRRLVALDMPIKRKKNGLR